MASTYTPIQTTTLGSATASYTFSSIPGTYTDLVLVVNTSTSSGGQSVGVRFNSDSGNNYSSTDLYSDSANAYSGRTTGTNFIRIVGRGVGTSATLKDSGITHIPNYADTSAYKSVLIRSAVLPGPSVCVARWANTSAITSITIFGEAGTNLISGSTLTLYGITAA